MWLLASGWIEPCLLWNAQNVCVCPYACIIEDVSCLIAWPGTASTPLRRTWQLNGIGVAELLRGLEELVVGHGREKRDHVIQPVVTDGRQLLRPGVVSGVKPLHPLVKDGIGKGVKNLQMRAWAHTFTKLFQNSTAFKTLSLKVAEAFERERRVI